MKNRKILQNINYVLIICYFGFAQALIENGNFSEENETHNLDNDIYDKDQLLPVIIPSFNNKKSDYDNIEIISAPIITVEDLQPLNNPIEHTTITTKDSTDINKTANSLKKRTRVTKKHIEDTISNDLTSLLKPSAKKLRILSSLLPSDGGNLKELLDLDNIFTAIIKYFEKEPVAKAENIQEKILNGQKKNSFLYDFITSPSNLRPIRSPEFNIFESIGEGITDMFNNPLLEPPTLNLNLFGSNKNKHRLFKGNGGLMMAAANSLSRHLPTEKPPQKKLKPNTKSNIKSNTGLSNMTKRRLVPRQTTIPKEPEAEENPENAENLTKAVHNLKKVIKVVGELDSYLTTVFKSYIKRLAKLVDEDDKSVTD